MKQQITMATALLVLLSLSGCGKIINWAEDNIYQGCDTVVKRPECYIRSENVYDQFTTVGTFDALWLSDEVRTDYVNLYAYRFGKSEEQKNLFLRRQLEENNHFISFYFLNMYTQRMTDPSPVWSVLLSIDGQLFAPVDLKQVALDKEYIAFFGMHYTPFKTAYLIKFNARDMNDVPLINSRTQRIALVLRSIEKQVELVWCLNDLCCSQFVHNPTQDEKDLALEQEAIEI